MSRLERKVVIVVLLSLYVISSFSIKEPSQFLYWWKCLAKILRILSAVLYVATPIGFTHTELQQIKVQRFLHIPILPH